MEENKELNEKKPEDLTDEQVKDVSGGGHAVILVGEKKKERKPGKPEQKLWI